MKRSEKKTEPIQPPAWAERLLSWYCKPELLEDLQGDLNEYFYRNVEKKGKRRASLIYIFDVIKFFRLYTVRKPEFINLLIQWIMLRSYIKTSGRSILRNRLFSAINIIGLSVSMSVGLLAIAITSDFLSYDAFHEKKDRIYQVITTRQSAGNGSMTLASTSVKVGKKIREDITGIEEVVTISNGFAGDAHIGESVLPLSGVWANESFFHVFTYPLLQGNSATALKEPYSLVLTEKSAIRLFGTADALGKTIKIDTTNFTITGVAKNVPKLSQLQFDAVVSLSSKEIQAASDPYFNDWENVWSNYVYVLFPENTNVAAWQANLDKLNAEENKNLSKLTISASLQPMSKSFLNNQLSNSIGMTMPPITLWVLGGMALVIILSACFNYTNLSVARAMRRSREVSIRKVIGALRSHIWTQFITESVMIALLALVASLLLFFFLRAQFINLDPHINQLVSLSITPQLVAWFIAAAVAIGLLAGFLPALFFSRINAIRILKDASSLKVFRHLSLRKALIVVQYTFSLIFITTTIIGFKQYNSFIHFDLGFTTANVLNIQLQGNKAELLTKELSEIPEVSGISHSLMVPSLGSLHGTQLKYKDQQDSALVWLNRIDENYLTVHQYELLAGKNFSIRANKGEEREIMVNEQVLKRFDIAGQDPMKALGETVRIDTTELTIVAVLKDFHYGTVQEKIEPVIFQYMTDSQGGLLNVKINTSNLPATMTAIEKAWKKIDAAHPLDARFYDDQIEEAYSQFSVMIKVIGFISFLAVCIASMGLFGMVVFTTETKLKEISIRKVLGAGEGSLIYQLSKGFILLLVLAALIAIPLTYFFFDQVVLTSFAYHQPIGVIELFAGTIVIGILAFLMVSSQAWKAARTNPAQVLKSE